MQSTIPDSPLLKLQAVSRRIPDHAAFAGFSAAWLLGLDVHPCDPIEVTIPAPTTISTRSGLTVHRRAIDKWEIVKANGLRATSITRTLRDLCVRLSLTESVVIVDMALHARLVTVPELDAVVEQCFGAPGVRTLRRAIPYAEPASESPMETRLRMLLVLAGLPRPQAQIAVRDRLHRFLGRPDLYYTDQRLGLEYDGGTHRETLADDNRRQNRLLDAGVRLLRFTAADIYNSPAQTVNLVRNALAA